MKEETINWELVNSLGDKRANRLRKIEHVLASCPLGITPEDLCDKIGLQGRARIRTLQNDLNELRSLYTCQWITSAPYRLELRGGDLAFPEAEFNTKDRKQLNSICRLIAFFDGAIPIRDFLKVSLGDVDAALNDMSENIDIPTTISELRYIKDIYDAIENKVPIDMIYPRINGGRRFTLSPYMLKRFNGKWFVLGRISEENPFDWTVIPLAAIEMMSPNMDNVKYSPAKNYELQSLKNEIRRYYSNVLGFYVPTNETDKAKVSRELNPDKLQIEEVKLKVNKQIIRFLKENPIHSTQNIKDDTGEVTLKLVLNPLLKQKLLGFGADLEVVSPISLRNELYNVAQQMLTLYAK